MKLKTLTLLAALIPSQSAAQDQLPADVSGHWCEVRKLADAEFFYRRAARCPRERSLIVRTDGWDDGAGTRCTVISVDKTVIARCALSLPDEGVQILSHTSWKRRGDWLAVKYDEP